MQTINHVNVEQYYDLHKEFLGEFDLGNHPEKIYNMDEYCNFIGSSSTEISSTKRGDMRPLEGRIR